MTEPSFIYHFFILSCFTQHDSRNATVIAKTKTFRQLRLLLNTTINSCLIKPFNLQVNAILTDFVNKNLTLIQKGLRNGFCIFFNCQNDNGERVKLKKKTVYYKGIW